MKRWLLTIFLFLLSGAIVNVAVAWGCIAWSDMPRKPTRRTSDPTPADLRPFLDWRPDDCPDRLRYDYREWFAFGIERRRYRPATSILTDEGMIRWDGDKWWADDRPPGFRRVYWDVVMYRGGWPARALEAWNWSWGESQGKVLASGTSTAVAVIANKDPNQSDLPLLLPWMPVWPGFVVDTLSYAVIIWILFVAPFQTCRRLRSVIRIKRGRCPKCGYDLRGTIPGAGSGCPECGWMRESDSAAGPGTK